jgi:uncharacterized protein YndB with AHSA1/START domain
MATPATQPQSETKLRIARRLAAPREKVFRAWTSPEALRNWFAPSKEYQTTIPELDLRVGGRYRVEMRLGEKLHVVAGTYLEIRPPERLVFRWRWENEPAHVGDTVVTLEFGERDGQTELVLTHEGFAGVATRDEHEKGWNGCLDRLTEWVAGTGAKP